MSNLSKLASHPLSLILAVILGASLISSLGAQQTRDIYTWTDEEGVQHFSAYPPQGRPYELVETQARARNSGRRNPSSETASAEPPAMPAISESEPDPEIVAERCEQARTNLGLLSQDRPAVLRQDDGEAQPLNDARRQEMIEETEAFIEEWC